MENHKAMSNVPGDKKQFVEVPCSSAKEFFDYLNPNHKMWAGGVDNKWVFRGQNDATWDLTPSAWREKGREMFEPLAQKHDKDVDMIVKDFFESGYYTEDVYPGVREFSRQVLAECWAVTTFAELADRLGHRVPETQGPTTFIPPKLFRTILFDSETAVAESLGGTSGVAPPKYGIPDEKTALAQHHGMPTRLLDWSRNCRVAAFLAAHNLSRSPKLPDRIAVWALDLAKPRHLKNCGIDVLTVPRHEFENLHAQDGLFLYCDPRTRIMEGGNWPSLDTIIDEYSASEDVVPDFRDTPDRYKLTLGSEHSDELLRLLWKENISLAHLMPTYDNVVASIVRRWRWE